MNERMSELAAAGAARVQIEIIEAMGG